MELIQDSGGNNVIKFEIIPLEKKEVLKIRKN